MCAKKIPSIQKSVLFQCSEKFAQLLTVVNSDDFATTLGPMFKLFVPTNNVVIIYFPSKNLPLLEYNDLPPKHRDAMINQYLKGTFLLDPFYLAARKQRKNGFFQLRDVAPPGFTESEYYKTYFKHSGLSDECGYLIQLEDEGEQGEQFILISLGQIDLTERYSTQHLQTLADITPMIESLVKQHWVAKESEVDVQLDLRAQLETALQCFGNNLLTERENQVVKMILHGYSSKAIAERFNISAETIKLHRRNAYAKLDISSQGELFNLFINSLMNIENYHDGDPLISYFDVKEAV